MDGKASDWRPGPTVCRCCLTEGCYKDISTEYFWMGKREVYSEMLSETLNVSIAYSQSGGPNSNSRLICEPCISRLRDATEFKRQVIDCEKTFMNYLDGGSASSSKVTVETIGEVKVEMVKREKESLSDDDFDDRPDFLDVDDDDDDDLDDQPLTKLATKVPKKESVDLLDLLDNSQITVKRKPALKIKDAPPAKKTKKKEIVSKPSASKVAAMKKNEKKKDDEWTTTDLTQPIGIRRERRNVRPDYSEDNEWIVVDFKESMPNNTFLQHSDSINNPAIKQDSLRYDEWTTTLIRTSPDKVVDRTQTHRFARTGSVPKTKLRKLASTLNKTPRICKEKTQRVLKDVSKPQPKLRKPCGNRTLLQNAQLILLNTTAIPHRLSIKILDIPCYACDCKFKDPASFRAHCFNEHTNADKTRGINVFHIQTRVDITELACMICAQPLNSLEEAAQHLVQEHQININLEERLGLVPLKFSHNEVLNCAVCKKRCHSYRDLYRHSGSHYYLLICEICGKNFESLESMRLHRSMTHAEGHVCKRCRSVFPTKISLRQHIRDNENCHQLRCTICNITFGYFMPYQKHRETVHGVPKREYRCAQCSVLFDTNIQLYRHFKKEHTDDFKCGYCGKKFATSKCLRKHSTVHTDERPHTCSVCQQSFKSIIYMKNHVMKQH